MTEPGEYPIGPCLEALGAAPWGHRERVADPVFEADMLVFGAARDPGRMCAAALVWYQVIAAVVRMAAVALGQRTPEQTALPYAGRSRSRWRGS